MYEMMKSSMGVVEASNVSNVLFENDRVRVLQVIFQPNQTAKMHHHPDHVVYTVKGGTMRLVSEGKSDDVEMKEGSVVFFNATNHEATNISSSVIEMIVTELKR
jgi:quercetin dioxygenase-like cupin family protein